MHLHMQEFLFLRHFVVFTQMPLNKCINKTSPKIQLLKPFLIMVETALNYQNTQMKELRLFLKFNGIIKLPYPKNLQMILGENLLEYWLLMVKGTPVLNIKICLKILDLMLVIMKTLNQFLKCKILGQKNIIILRKMQFMRQKIIF
ncbi:hypothetical protein IMG5_150080 [Ichthyophthirius multifiliis]|uniref:Uncharacterized protein n=1 Tax=Ichthyophthirius multifiliis TaxID=5932 RepID=G0QYJ2_ICHMU|nr:hypothetical protein IMG5_150080 [Ichthyophthirius multifiliis]EGR29717.1 hypothetical protein IMG5_150080 [Ichthyophthirius multifiliis]|eukprot:XP_004030953.1 hypothetical protein IMG5_150080 [Ichthyophthirius multifiliis]